MAAASVWELAAQKFEKTAPEYASPLDMATALDPRVVRTPALDLINQRLVETMNKPDGRLIISMPPQEGKSQLGSRRFPLWALTQNPDLRVAIASYEANIARRWGRVIRDDLNQYTDRLGLRVRPDLASQAEWQLANQEGGVFTAGVGGAMTGRPVDLMIIDDPVKGREQADSPTIQEKTWTWWTDTVLTRLAPGAPVILILTRWSENDLAGKLLDDEPDVWEFLNIPAQAEGDNDPLGRDPDEFMISARGRTTAQWEARKRSSGPVTWASLYQGRPSPAEGGIFPTDWPTYDTPIWVQHDDGRRTVPGIDREDHELIQSWDLAFKGGDRSDFVVGQVWLRVGADVYLLDQIRGRMDFNRTLQAVKDMTAKWPQAGAKFIEDKANGPAVINSLSQSIPGIIPVEPEGGKVARANAISPFAHAKNIHLPAAALLSNVQDLRDEALNFPNAAHDDTIDGMTQAVNQLLLRPLTGGPQDLDELVPDTEMDWSLSPY
ncbi:phage terminase large subunit [Citricoccus sp. K5]|uniref:phage terminase large subunit n=1 Tax=Citricoccus sp. K5 TaxID=2653135 RepID=UPI0012F119C0|nr:phage terminase large subunit [Citricoccus sp. K5]VXA92623.1 Terminase [Citricoccus sp. K5]VXA95181.1 Terminase [Citricoccus sp. K5]